MYWVLEQADIGEEQRLFGWNSVWQPGPIQLETLQCKILLRQKKNAQAAPIQLETHPTADT